jgi:hypothetical protein
MFAYLTARRKRLARTDVLIIGARAARHRIGA